MYKIALQVFCLSLMGILTGLGAFGTWTAITNDNADKRFVAGSMAALCGVALAFVVAFAYKLI